ncbi:MAG: class I SAM-dependent methyltransferase [Legionella sp.]|jgi:SAM-dependent methyltransferase
MKNFMELIEQVRFVMRHNCFDDSEILLDKKLVQETYTHFGNLFYQKNFMNWGLWDKNIYTEYKDLRYDFSRICPFQDIHSILLVYYVIRPLVSRSFFDKTLVEVGCGNGIGLKASSELLKTKYSLGVDLTHKLVTNAHSNFYQKERINYIQSDAEHLPLASGSVDIITNIESSHIYPRVVDFYSEVARVLAPGGYFCYADCDVIAKSRRLILEDFIKSSTDLKILEKHDITKMVQDSIYRRAIVEADLVYASAKNFFDENKDDFMGEVQSLLGAMGLRFLPWWRIRFKDPKFRAIAKNARRYSFGKRKKYFYYLIQKIS